MSLNKKNKIILFFTILILVLISVIIYFVTRTKQNYNDPLDDPINKGIKDFLIKNKNNPIIDTGNILKTKNPEKNLRLYSAEKPKIVYPDYVLKSYCPNGECQYLGQGYNLSQINIHRPSDFPTPRSIFKKDSLNLTKNQICLPFYNAGILSQDSVRLNTTEKIVNNMSNSTGGSGGFLKNLINFAASIDAIASSSSATDTNTQAAKLTIEDRTGRIDISADNENNYCTSDNINESVLKDFMNLSSNIINPDNQGDWEEYTQFVNTYGTHVVTSVHFGAKIEVWESLLDNSTENTKYLGIQACVAMDKKGKSKENYSNLEGDTPKYIDKKIKLSCFFSPGKSPVDPQEDILKVRDVMLITPDVIKAITIPEFKRSPIGKYYDNIIFLYSSGIYDVYDLTDYINNLIDSLKSKLIFLDPPDGKVILNLPIHNSTNPGRVNGTTRPPINVEASIDGYPSFTIASVINNFATIKIEFTCMAPFLIPPLTFVPEGTDFKFDICNSYTEDDYKKATRLDIQKHTYFMGGEGSIRNSYSNLTIDTISREQIMAFLNSSKDSNQAISFYFTPVWDIITSTLISKRYRNISPYDAFPDSKYRQISTNLLTYYVKSLACPPKTDSKGNRMQWLGKTGNETTGNTSYQCNNIGTGCGARGDNCHQDWGCKARGGAGSFKISTTPYKFSCPGNPVYPTELGTSGDMGCYHKAGAGCRCGSPAQDKPVREIWNSSGCSA